MSKSSIKNTGNRLKKILVTALKRQSLVKTRYYENNSLFENDDT